PMYEDSIALLKFCGHEDVEPYGGGCLDNTGGFNGIELIWHRQHLERIHNHVLSITTTSEQRAYAVIDVPIGHAVADRGNSPSYFEARNIRGAFWHVVTADALEHIGVVDTSSFNFDQHLPCCHLRYILGDEANISRMLLAEFVDAALRNKANCLHL